MRRALLPQRGALQNHRVWHCEPQGRSARGNKNWRPLGINRRLAIRYSNDTVIMPSSIQPPDNVLPTRLPKPICLGSLHSSLATKSLPAIALRRRPLVSWTPHAKISRIRTPCNTRCHHLPISSPQHLRPQLRLRLRPTTTALTRAHHIRHFQPLSFHIRP